MLCRRGILALYEYSKLELFQHSLCSTGELFRFNVYTLQESHFGSLWVLWKRIVLAWFLLKRRAILALCQHSKGEPFRLNLCALQESHLGSVSVVYRRTSLSHVSTFLERHRVQCVSTLQKKTALLLCVPSRRTIQVLSQCCSSKLFQLLVTILRETHSIPLSN